MVRGLSKLHGTHCDWGFNNTVRYIGIRLLFPNPIVMAKLKSLRHTQPKITWRDPHINVQHNTVRRLRDNFETSRRRWRKPELQHRLSIQPHMLAARVVAKTIIPWGCGNRVDRETKREWETKVPPRMGTAMSGVPFEAQATAPSHGRGVVGTFRWT